MYGNFATHFTMGVPSTDNQNSVFCVVFLMSNAGSLNNCQNFNKNTSSKQKPLVDPWRGGKGFVGLTGPSWVWYGERFFFDDFTYQLSF